MGAFICRMTTSNQDRQWVKLVNPLKPKRDEIDLFEQSWSLSWLYQQRWISLENKRLFFLGKPYWFSPSAVNGNGFGKFSSFLSLEWTSYPPLIFFSRSQTKRSRNPWGLGIGMPANLYQVTISSNYHCNSDLLVGFPHRSCHCPYTAWCLSQERRHALRGLNSLVRPRSAPLHALPRLLDGFWRDRSALWISRWYLDDMIHTHTYIIYI